MVVGRNERDRVRDLKGGKFQVVNHYFGSVIRGPGKLPHMLEGPKPRKLVKNMQFFGPRICNIAQGCHGITIHNTVVTCDVIQTPPLLVILFEYVSDRCRSCSVWSILEYSVG
jgi:hypothetical protein